MGRRREAFVYLLQRLNHCRMFPAFRSGTWDFCSLVTMKSVSHLLAQILRFKQLFGIQWLQIP